MKQILHYIYLFVGLIFAYLLFGCISACLPDKPIQKSIIKTNHSGDLWHNYLTAGIPQHQCQQDNFTDNLILNQAWHCSSDSLITSVLLLPRSSGPDALDQANCLYRLIQGEDSKIYYYGRYWHGSTFLMRFLLLFLGSYPHIRLFLYLVSSILLLWLCANLWQKVHPVVAVAVLLGFSMLNLFVMQLSIQFVVVLIISLVGSLMVCRWYKNTQRIMMLFFVIGSLTAYFDLLTIPLLSLGIPLSIWAILSLSQLSEIGFVKSFLKTLYNGILWALGYGLTWVSKWAIATLFTPINVLKDGIAQTSYRTDVIDYSRWDALTANTNFVPWTLFMVGVLVLTVWAVCRFRKEGIVSAILLFCIGLTPFVWYLLVSNHSYEHCWFTYRALIVTLVSWYLAIISLIRFEHK